MKTRHILAVLIGAGLIVWALASCKLLGGTTIDQRIASFQNDMNTTDRSSAYQNFDPGMTEYATFLNGATFSTAFPVPTTANYTFMILDESNTSAVIVQVTTGPQGGGGYLPPSWYLSLNMTEASGNNWLIHSLSESTGVGGPYSTLYN